MLNYMYRWDYIYDIRVKIMNVNTFKQYLDIFVGLYKEKQILIDLRGNQTIIRSKEELRNILDRINPNIDEEQFVETVFKIIDIAKSITTGTAELLKEEIEDDYIDLVNNYFLQDQSIKNTIATDSLITQDYIGNIEYEILTKRNRQNVSEILGYTLQLKIEIKNSTQDTKRIVCELSKDEVSKLIEILQGAIEDIKLLTDELG